jgi:hypothetical protein
MTNDKNANVNAHGEQRGAVLLQGEGGVQYLLPSEVLETFRVDADQSAAPRSEDDVRGYLEGFGLSPYVWRYLEGGAASAWNAFTFALAGSTAKFEVEGDPSPTGVRG